MMSAGVEIKVIDPNDSSIYSRSANSRLISSDDQVMGSVKTSRSVQVASGKRRGFEAKNDSSGKQTSERRVNSHMPQFDEEELKIPSVVFEAVSIPEAEPVVVDLRTVSEEEVTPLSPKILSEYGRSIIQLNVSPPAARKPQVEPIPKEIAEKPKSNRKQLSKRRKDLPTPPTEVDNETLESLPMLIEPVIMETSVTHEVGTEEVAHEVSSEEVAHEIAPKSSRRRVTMEPGQIVEKPKSNRKPSSRRRKDLPTLPETAEQINSSPMIIEPEPIIEKPKSNQRSISEIVQDVELSPRASRRAKSSPRKVSSKSKKESQIEASKAEVEKLEKSPPNPTSGNVHYDDRSVISPQPIVDTQGSDRHSNRRRDVASRVKSDPRPTGEIPKKITVKAPTASEPKLKPTIQKSSSKPETVAQPKVNSTKKKPPKPTIEISSRPKSPHRVNHEQPTIRIGGREVTSRDYVTGDSDSSSARTPENLIYDEETNMYQDYSQEATPPTPSDSSNTDTTTRRKIKSRQDAIDKGIREKFNQEEFCPGDDEHLGEAIKIALLESQKQSVQEAIDNGEDLNAEVLKSLHRPNAISEVIEKLVSQRRDKIVSQRREKQVSSKRSKKENRNVKSKEVSKNKSLVNEKTVHVRKTHVKKQDVKAISTAKASVVEDDEQPDIETVDEPISVVKPQSRLIVDETSSRQTNIPQPVVFTPPPQKKTTSKKRAQPVVIEEISQQKEDKEEQQHNEPVQKSKKSNKIPSKPKVKQPVVVEEDSDEEGMVEEPVEPPAEENVKLPKANRPPRPTDDPHVEDIRTGKKILKQKDQVYDPLGMPEEPDDEDSESIGDNVYEESSEDDDVKLTINEKKDEMFYRFKLVREAYPGISLPRITRKMKLAKMVRYYEHVMSRIKLKVKTNNFKIFLIIGFLVMQFAGKKLGLNTEGFTVNQMTSMKRYERMLREFGESDWSSIGVDLPVTIRLPFFMLVNMGIFVIAKWIFQKTKKDYSVQFHKLYAQLTGGDDYVFLKDETGDSGMGAGDGAEDGGGGIFGMLKPILSMFGGMGGGNGGGDNEDKPKRGEAAGPSYVRKPRKARE
jgi:hypothetical protein